MTQQDHPSHDTADYLDFLSELPPVEQVPNDPVPWPVLIVDDEADVHQTTTLALKGLSIQGRKLRLLHAYSAAEAREIIRTEPDLAVVLLDVVMESVHAGLGLVRLIREDLGRDAIRIILRTGQPGYAPEIDTIRRYDINDYKTKTELTRVRLFTSLTVAIRSYQQIQTLSQSRKGLELIVAGSAQLSKLRGLQMFAEGVVMQLSALLGVAPDGLICAQNALQDGETPRIIAAAGQYSRLMHLPLDQITIAGVRTTLERCLQERRNQLGDTCCLYISASNGRGMAAFINSPRRLEAVDESLLQVFCSSVSVALENVLLYGQLLDYAYTDQLLRLPNRIRFVEMIEQQLRQPDGMTLALIDIDDFSGVNNALGHQFGDMVLRSVASRMNDTFGTDASLARVAGDTMGVLGPEALVNPERLTSLFTKPFEIGRQQMRVSASFGLVRLRHGMPDGAELIKDANLALKQAKAHQRGSAQYFSVDMGELAKERMQLLNNLREAFEQGRLFVAYQPQVRLDDDRVMGLEALLRWRMENGDLVSPDQFVPLAEQSGLIVAIGEFVLRTALQQLHRLQTMGQTRLRMSINVSQIQLREQHFVPMLKRALEAAEVDPRDVELEITESTAMKDVAFMIAVLADLSAIGVAVAIDDFGTGYSSLAVLRQLRVQRLKIDKAFVQQLKVDNNQGAIARMVIDLAQNLGMDVIAEGVESASQRATLRAMGCSEAQGFLFARPMIAGVLEAWLSDRHTSFNPLQ